LSSVLLVALHGFDLVRMQDGKSYLVGTFPDQAGLFEMLGVLRDLNIAVVSIEMTSSDTDQGAAPTFTTFNVSTRSLTEAGSGSPR
jgi:hypothetical protein